MRTIEIHNEIPNKKYLEFQKNGNGNGVITFFTPTFNRSHLLFRLYDCLLNQTNKNFVWIIVNDGSSDDTNEVAKRLILRNDFPALLISKSNGGKHSSFEVAFNRCKSDFFACMDDDDLYKQESVQVFLDEWKVVKDDKRDDIGAIRVLTAESNGKITSSSPISASMMEQRVDQTTFESNYIKGEHMENWTCYKTSALQSVNLFPHDYWMADQHKFYTESLWQGRFARKFKCRYYYHILREYRYDTVISLSHGHHDRQHYIDMFINGYLLIEEQYDWICRNWGHFLKSLAILSILCMRLHIPYQMLLANTSKMFPRIIETLFYPLGYIVKRPRIIS